MSAISPTIGDVTVKGHGCFISPTASNIPDGVPSSPEDKERQVLLPHEANTLSMAWRGGEDNRGRNEARKERMGKEEGVEGGRAQGGEGGKARRGVFEGDSLKHA